MKGECTSRVQNRQRKKALFARPVHADAFASFKLLTGLEDMIEIAHIVQDAHKDAFNLALRAENDLNFEQDDCYDDNDGF